MSDPMSQVFIAAIGLPSPWRVEQVRFEPQANEIHFDVVCDAKTLPSGGEQMDGSAVLEYFAPLQTWLVEQNKGKACGWSGEAKPAAPAPAMHEQEISSPALR